MEGLLRSPQISEIDKLYREAFDLQAGVAYFPVRHHSPACSFHLKQVLDTYQPEAVLIEGPFDTNQLLGFLGHEESAAPLCIYYSYADNNGLIGAKGGKYNCYYPFLDYSPELVALRAGLARGLAVEFIDLPYPEILRVTNAGEGLREEAAKVSYNDDYLLARSQFLAALCELEGCRNFAELWEKLYEIDGLSLSSGEFVRNMLGFCYLARCDQNEEMLGESLARERFMAGRIRQARRQYRRVLVVTGGFHTPGLLQLAESHPAADDEVLGGELSTGFRQEAETGSGQVNKAAWDASDAAAYLMAYSFEESDQLGGYASGMPYPAFYQQVWQNLCQRELKPYEQSILHFIVRCGRTIRRNNGVLSTADELEAFNLAKGLAGLRDKPECGVYELADAVQAAFVKGELTLSNEAPLAALHRLLRGRKIGKVCNAVELPPVVRDFRERAGKFKLKTNTTAEQELVLDVYRSKRHREISRFLHTMAFLEVDYCRLVKGPDFVRRKNINLVRETWKYGWNTRVESRLTELSVYGGNLAEVARELLLKRLNACGAQAVEASRLLVDAYLMGLEEEPAKILALLEEALHQDGSFLSCADSLYNLGLLVRSKTLLDSGESQNIGRTAGLAYFKTVYLMSGLHGAGEPEENELVAKLKDVYYVTLHKELGLDSDNFADSLLGLTGHPECNPCLEGAGLGILLGLNKIAREPVIQTATGYLYGTGEKFLNSARFLKGLFAAARDIILTDIGLLSGIDAVLGRLGEEEFLKLLPDLRLAFSYFTPGEIDSLGVRVADMYDLSPAMLLQAEAVAPEDVELGLQLDRYARGNLAEWGISDEQ